MEFDIGKNDELSCLYQAQVGDPHAIECLLRQYTRLVRSVARMYTLQGAEIEDMIQEGLLALLSAIQSYRAEQGVPFFYYARLCIDRRMQSTVRQYLAQKHAPLNQALSLDVPPVLEPYPHTFADPESLIIGREEHQELLNQLLAVLSHFEARVLKLYLYGLSCSEIASFLEKPKKSIENAMQRIHKKARQL